MSEYAGDMPWIVTAVEPRKDYSLLVSFIDGSKKTYDMCPLLDVGVFRQLKNLNLFMQAHTNGSSVVWNDDLDIAPEELYENGVPVE